MRSLALGRKSRLFAFAGSGHGRLSPYGLHTVLIDNDVQFCHPPRYRDGPTAKFVGHLRTGNEFNMKQLNDYAIVIFWPDGAEQPWKRYDLQASDELIPNCKPSGSNSSLRSFDARSPTHFLIQVGLGVGLPDLKLVPATIVSTRHSRLFCGRNRFRSLIGW